MAPQSEMPQPTASIIDYSGLREKMFWVKLLTGAVFGTLSYFIIRFFVHVTLFVFIPGLYLVTYLLILLGILVKSGMRLPSDVKTLLRLPLNYTGTWLMAFFVFGTACYYFGW